MQYFPLVKVCTYLGSKNKKSLRGSTQALASIMALESIVTLILPPLYFLYSPRMHAMKGCSRVICLFGSSLL